MIQADLGRGLAARVHGCELLEAADGEEALAVVRERCRDLIRLDVMRPKMDGVEVCRRLNGDPAFQFLSVILVTARADSKDDRFRFCRVDVRGQSKSRSGR